MRIDIEFRLDKNNITIVTLPSQSVFFYREGDDVVLSGSGQYDGEYTVTKIIHEISIRPFMENIIVYLG